MSRVLDSIDSGMKSIYNIDVWRAMQWKVKKWRRCPEHVIHCCCTHCFRQVGDLELGIEQEVEAETLKNVQMGAHEHGVNVTKALLYNMLNAEEEEDVLENVKWDDEVHEMAGIMDYEKVEDERQIVAAVEKV